MLFNKKKYSEQNFRGIKLYNIAILNRKPMGHIAHLRNQFKLSRAMIISYHINDLEKNPHHYLLFEN